jgi:hypothetical protein
VRFGWDDERRRHIREVAMVFGMKIHFSKSLKRRTQSSQRKPVRCLETGLIYASSSDASDILSAEGKLIEPRNIISVCQGKQRSAGGLQWEYVEIDPIHINVMQTEYGS